MYYTDGCIYRLKRRTTETTGVLHNQLRDQGAKEWISTATPSRGCTNKVILHSYEKWHRVQYAARCLSMLNVKRCYDFSGPRDTDVKWEKKSAHHATPILESMSYGHSSHPKLKSTHNDCNTVLLLYFHFLFSALFSIRNPALLASHQRQKIHPTKLPTRAICFSPETWNVTKRILFLSHSFNDTNDGTLSPTFNLALYRLWTV